jgi:phage-related protein
MKPHFKILLSSEAEYFLDTLDEKIRSKIIYNIDKAKYTLDPKIFKKLTKEIWEFRTKFSTTEYRLFAFWDKKYGKNTLVIATHGIIKKTQKVPRAEIEKAMRIRHHYFSQK